MVRSETLAASNGNDKRSRERYNVEVRFKVRFKLYFGLAKPAFFRYNENLHWDKCFRLDFRRLPGPVCDAGSFYKYLRNSGDHKVIDSIKYKANEIIENKTKMYKK